MIRKILKIVLLVMCTMILAVVVYGVVQYSKVSGVNHFISQRVVQAPKDKVWEIISDVADYEEVTGPGIDRVEILQGSGLGMVRECADATGYSWEETCTIWEPGHRFKFEVNTQREDYASPYKSLSGLWEVVELGPATTRITMDFAYEFNNPFIAGILLNLALAQAKEDCEFIMDNWQRMAEQGEGN